MFFEACRDNAVENVTFASTACVYPTSLQKDLGSNYKLREEDSNPFNTDGFLSADLFMDGKN